MTDQRRLDDWRQNAHDTFRHLVEHSPFGVYAVDADFRLVQVSDGAQKVFESVRPLLGRDLAEVLRLIWAEPFASEAIGRFRHTLASGEAFHAPSTVELRRDVAQIEAYDWKLERLMLPDGRLGVVCHFYDLTERQEHESEIRDREEQLRFALNAAGAAPWSLDTESGAFMATDDAMAMHGLQPGTQVSHDAALGCVHTEDRAMVDAAVRVSLASGEPLRVEYRVLHSGGSVNWVASHAELRVLAGRSRLVGLVQDITERKLAEQALRDQRAAEHDVAVSLQRALLPPGLLRHPLVEIGVRYVPGDQGLEVGGDWYDTFILEDGRIAITVGDVVGHGIEAAAAMGQLRTAVAALAPLRAPSVLFADLADFVSRTHLTEFATLCYGLYDPGTGAFEYISAGHPPILAISPSGAAEWLDGARALPLTPDLQSQWHSATVTLVAGTLILMFSDGLIERRGECIDSGLQRLLTTALEAHDEPVQSLCDHIIRNLLLDAHVDDAVVLAARLGQSV